MQQTVCFETFCEKDPVIAGRFAGRKLDSNSNWYSIHKCLINEKFLVYTQFTNMVAGRIIQPNGQQVGDPCLGVRYRVLYLYKTANKTYLYVLLFMFYL